MEYILQHARTLTQTLGYFQTPSKSITENSPRRLQNKRQIQLHISNTYRSGTSSVKHFVHPVTVATFGDQLCHPEPKYWEIFQKKGPMSLHLRHIYLLLITVTVLVQEFVLFSDSLDLFPSPILANLYNIYTVIFPR